MLAIKTFDEHGISAASNASHFQHTGQTRFPKSASATTRSTAVHSRPARVMQTDPIDDSDGQNRYARFAKVSTKGHFPFD